MFLWIFRIIWLTSYFEIFRICCSNDMFCRILSAGVVIAGSYQPTLHHYVFELMRPSGNGRDRTALLWLWFVIGRDLLLLKQVPFDISFRSSRPWRLEEWKESVVPSLSTNDVLLRLARSVRHCLYFLYRPRTSFSKSKSFIWALLEIRWFAFMQTLP